MALETWVVQSKLRGDFVIPDKQLEVHAQPDGRLKRLEVAPEFDDSDKYTGVHVLTLDLMVDNPTGVPLASNVIFSEAKEAAERVASLISLSTGRPVLVESTSVKSKLSDTPSKYRIVIGQSQAAAIAPTTMFDPTLLTLDLDARTRRVIRWWARGVAADNGVDRLASLTTALDLLAGMQKGVPGRTRTCKACGHAEEIGPGLRERVVAYLTTELGYDEQVATEVYESRIDLAHGRSDLSEEDLIRFRSHSKLVAQAMRDGLSKRLGVELSVPPEALPFDLPSALLDLEYVEPPAE